MGIIGKLPRPEEKCVFNPTASQTRLTLLTVLSKFLRPRVRFSSFVFSKKSLPPTPPFQKIKESRIVF